ncbi:unnamed protein product [Symbiodinium microadriaticum]|nr:unnamed protein product [Symbiodinium sp. KB8]CAE7786143.1 unnamed protein product [Symbiodinium microadriaticum]
MSHSHVDSISTESSPSFKAPAFTPADYEGELDKLNSVAQKAEGGKDESGKSPKKGIKRLERFEVKEAKSSGECEAQEQAEEEGEEDDEQMGPRKKPAKRGGRRKKQSSSGSEAVTRIIKKKKDDTDESDDDDDDSSEAHDVHDKKKKKGKAKSGRKASAQKKVKKTSGKKKASGKKGGRKKGATSLNDLDALASLMQDAETQYSGATGITVASSSEDSEDEASADDCHGPDLPPDGGAAAAPAAEPVDAEAAVPNYGKDDSGRDDSSELQVEEKWTHGRGTADPVIFLEPYVETYAGTQLIPETQVDET